MLTNEEILEALIKVIDPELKRSIVELNMVRDIKTTDDGEITFTLVLTIAACPLKSNMEEDAKKVLMALPGVKKVNVVFGEMTEEERKAIFGNGQPELPKLNAFNKVSKVIAILSGKGGVGKSSITAMLAVELTRAGKKVGILDADVTGPSIPKLFGLPAGGLRGSDQGILPAVTGLGIKVVSTNLMVPNENAAVIWRGPMISGTIQQFWRDVLWGKLDYLLVDLPPGTSDAALTVMQNIPINGVVLVSTPQELAGMVVRKADSMLKQLKVPVVAVVENMSYFTCPDCGKNHEIFGPSHIEELAKFVETETFIKLPIDTQVAAQADSGKIEEAKSFSLSKVIAAISA